MTHDDYAGRIADLRHEIDEGAADPRVIDAGVAELAADGDPCLSRDLLSLLSDKVRDDEGMFTLVHAAEASDDPHYVAALLDAFPTLLDKAPRWVSIVLMRSLNADGTRDELVRQLKDASPQEKAAVREACRRIDAVSPQFLAKTVAVTLAAG